MSNKEIKCPKCGYAISISLSGKCPRCGTIIHGCRGCTGNCLKCNSIGNTKKSG